MAKQACLVSVLLYMHRRWELIALHWMEPWSRYAASKQVVNHVLQASGRPSPGMLLGLSFIA